MNGPADRLEALIRQRIHQNRYQRSDTPRLGGLRFTPLQLPVSGVGIGRDYQRQRWSVSELLAHYDRQFVQHAYLVLLKRDADVEGLNGRLRQLQSGAMTRLELLFRLRYGPEGKQHRTVVKGLLQAFAIERACSIPVLGAIPRYLRALVYLPRMQRDLDELRGLVAMQKNELDDRDRAIVDYQNEQLANIVRHLDR
jgi:hypothetical protein